MFRKISEDEKAWDFRMNDCRTVRICISLTSDIKYFDHIAHYLTLMIIKMIKTSLSIIIMYSNAF